MFAAYARALRVRVLASVMGEQGLPESDRRFLAFGERFERQFVHQANARTLEESLEAGWAVLQGLPHGELTRLSNAQIGRHLREDSACLTVGEVAATRVALLELRDERRLVQEGYELLDEKRVLLATEILRDLRAHDVAQTALDRLWLAAREALAAAVEVHGFEDLTVEPPCLLDTVLLRQAERSFLGLRLAEASLDVAPCVPDAPPVRGTPELKRCAERLSPADGELVAQAARAANLRRLIDGIPPDGAARPCARERAAAGNRPFPEVHRGAARRRGPGGSRPRPQRRARSLIRPVRLPGLTCWGSGSLACGLTPGGHA